MLITGKHKTDVHRPFPCSCNLSLWLGRQATLTTRGLALPADDVNKGAASVERRRHRGVLAAST